MRKLMSRQWQITTAVGIVLVLALALGAMPALAQKSIEQFQANAIVQTRGAGSMMEINIYRWSSDEERDELAEKIGSVIYYKALRASKDGRDMLRKGIRTRFGASSY